MKKAKDVAAILAGIGDLWAMTKTVDWWKGLMSWQAVLVLATLYLIWWTIDHYYDLICKRVDVAKGEAHTATKTLGTDIAGLKVALSDEVRNRLDYNATVIKPALNLRQH